MKNVWVIMLIGYLFGYAGARIDIWQGGIGCAIGPVILFLIRAVAEHRSKR